MGISTDLFTGPINPEFICSICQDVFDEPVSLVECEHLFCKSCISSVRKNEDGQILCPLCKVEIHKEPKQPHRFMLNLWKELKLKCKWHKEGCQKELTVEENSKHTEECEHNPENKNKCERCGGKQTDEHDCVNHLKNQLALSNSMVIKMEGALKEALADNMELVEMCRLREMQIASLRMGQMTIASTSSSAPSSSSSSTAPSSSSSSTVITRPRVKTSALRDFKLYAWGPWKILKGNHGDRNDGDYFYIWNANIALQVGSRIIQTVTYLSNGKLTMVTDGVATFLSRLDKVVFCRIFREIVGKVRVWREESIMDPGVRHRLTVGQWFMLCGSDGFQLSSKTHFNGNHIMLDFDAQQSTFNYFDFNRRKTVHFGNQPVEEFTVRPEESTVRPEDRVSSSGLLGRLFKKK